MREHRMLAVRSLLSYSFQNQYNQFQRAKVIYGALYISQRASENNSPELTKVEVDLPKVERLTRNFDAISIV